MLTLSIAVAFRAFFVALSDKRRAAAIRQALETPTEVRSQSDRIDAQIAAEPARIEAPKGDVSTNRSEALTLLSMLQREARLVDLIQEPLDQYSDSQVGAAARPCLIQCRTTLERAFDLTPIIDEQEGAIVTVPDSASPLSYQWIGSGQNGSAGGRLVHPGWQAKRCEVAKWTGKPEDSLVISPAQLEN
jgi:hypothetical protein